MDQSYKRYIGVKLIEAYPCSKWDEKLNADREGYNVKYPDGYESWSPKEAFENAYLGLDTNGIVITPGVVQKLVSTVDVTRIDPKTTLVKSELVTGFMQYETSSCVDPVNYSEEIGKTMAMKKVENQLWFALGFVLQWAAYGLKHNPKKENSDVQTTQA